jgi:pimeloyl-ACP methyl ester carboxylesterase
MKKIALTIAFYLCIILVSAQTPAIYTEESGKGNVILFLPGFTSPGSVWDETISNLEGDFNSIKVSYAGFNGLPAIEMPWYATIKEELLQYIEEKNLENITIIGHSMGGTLAADIASSIPTKIKELVLVDALPCMRAVMMPGVPAEAIQYESPYNTQMLLQTDGARGAMAQMMSVNMTNNKEKVALLTKWSLEADKETFVYGYTDLLKLDLRSELSKITAKVLILGAPFPNADLVTKNYMEQYANLGQKEIVVAADSKHFIMFDQPQWLCDQVNTFLSK